MICPYVALEDGTTVETGSQEGERKEWKFTLEKHPKKAAYRMRVSFKSRILMRKSMTRRTACSADPASQGAKRQKIMMVAEKVWGDGARPTAWVNDLAFQKLERLWAKVDRAPNANVLDDISVAADGLDVAGDLREFRRNLFAKIEKRSNGERQGKKEDSSDSSSESSSESEEYSSSSSSHAA